MQDETIECVKVSMQLNLELEGTHSLEKEYVDNLCSAFSFWYKTFIVDNSTLMVDIFFPANNYIYHSDFNAIIKTFALQHGYLILHSYIVEMPYVDAICLDV
ncbi:hypothetical protein [Capnocytophaga gingivalis]|uniref:hypothetical protein n=1 Tax=Capnocytophaga gingivalis TaxID=1017 RepID=UPI0028D8D859|nr:hypothetical protein [Capnocytophaga gingivalis]